MHTVDQFSCVAMRPKRAMVTAALIAGSLLAVGCSGSHHAAARKSATTTSRAARQSSTTTTGASTIASTLPTTTPGSEPVRPLPGTTGTNPPQPNPTPTTTIPVGSPWPPGTIVGNPAYRRLTGTVTFTPAEALTRTSVSFRATLTNPGDQWLFCPLTAPWGFSIYLYTPETEDSDLIPYIVNGVAGSAPEFRHRTPTGTQTGLLLAPHASYSFTNHAFAPAWDFETSDFVTHADIIFEPVGVADAAGPIVRDAGSFTVLVPPPPTTTTTTGGA